MSSDSCPSSSMHPDFTECRPVPLACDMNIGVTPGCKEKKTTHVVSPIFRIFADPCVDSRKEATLKMLSILKHVSDSTEHYLEDKEGVPDAFFLYSVADSFNLLNFLGRTAMMTYIDVEIESCDLDKNTDAIKSRDQIYKMFSKLEKYSKRIRNIAMSIPSSQNTRAE